MSITIHCDHCKKVCVGVAYRLSGVDPGYLRPINKDAHLHWDCVPLYQRDEQSPGAFHIFDEAEGMWYAGGDHVTLRRHASVYNGRDAARLAAQATNTRLYACGKECQHDG